MPVSRTRYTAAEFVALLWDHGTIDGVQRAIRIGNDTAYELLAEANARGYRTPTRVPHRPPIRLDRATAERAIREAGSQVAAAKQLGVSLRTLKRRLREWRKEDGHRPGARRDRAVG